MEECINQAKKAFKCNEVPVGAVIVHRSSRQIISRAYNMVEKKNNALLHAEIIVINNACKILKHKNLSDYDLYVNLEPCAMCASAISYARIGKLFYGASDIKQGAVENGVRFFTSSSCFHRPEIYSGLLSDISSNLIISFFKKIR
jgi:tRNA(adenine34) deaminase